MTVGALAITGSAVEDRKLREHAKEIASQEEFCVQVASGLGRRSQRYVPIRSPHGTWELRKLGRGGYHHAVLVVGGSKTPRTFHWSRFRQRFVEGTYGPLPIVCEPAHNYFESAPGRFTPGDTNFTLDGRSFRIPREYRAEPVWPGSMVGYRFDARPPTFHPADRNCAQAECPTVLVAFEQNGGHGIAQHISPAGTPGTGELSGLNRLPGTNEKFVQISGDGKLISAIDCTSDCLHRFSSGDVTFTFRHSRSDLSRWREMQERLIGLHKRFRQ